MPVLVDHKSAHTYGVLDPAMAERRDTKFVASSLSDALNVIMMPQGGYRDRGGSSRHGLARKSIAQFALDAGMLTAPNSGTVANLLDGDDATTLDTTAVPADPFVVLEIDLGAAQNVVAVDVSGFLAGTASRDDALEVQYDSGAGWVRIGPAQNLRTTARSRRLAVAPSAGSVSAQNLRIVVTGGAGPGTISIGGLKVWTDAGVAVEPRLFRFNRSVEERFMLVVTPENADVFQDGAYQASVALPVTEAMLERLKTEKKDDSLTLWHHDLPPQLLQWQGAADEWQAGPIPFKNIPRHDFGDVVYANGVNEIQRINLVSIGAGNSFELELEGEITLSIINSGNTSVNMDRIKDALEALSNVDAGLTVTGHSSTDFSIEFTGGDNAARDWLQMSGIAHNEGGVVTVRTTQKGQAGGEDPFSASRGYPAVGRFVSGRLVMAGLKSLPNHYLASVSGDVFNLNIQLPGAAAAMLYAIDDEDLGEIWDIRVGQSLLFFTDSAIWHLVQTDFSAEQRPQLQRSDAPGIEPHMPPLSLDNSIFYIQRGGQVLRQLSFSEIERNFLGENASVLSSFLIDQPKSWALRRARKDNDADLLMLTDAAGRMVTITLMRAQDVSGFAPHGTAGSYVSLQADAESDIWQICERQVAGENRYVLERMEPDGFTDSAVLFELAPASDTLTGLSAYEGQELHVWADQHFVGKFTVSGGAITLPYAVSRAEAGFWTAPSATDVRFVLDEETGRPQARVIRVFKTEISLLDTTSCALRVNDGELFDVPFEIHDETPEDSPRGERPFTGQIEHEGWPGFTEGGHVTVTQMYPGRLHVRQVKKGMVA